MASPPGSGTHLLPRGPGNTTALRAHAHQQGPLPRGFGRPPDLYTYFHKGSGSVCAAAGLRSGRRGGARHAMCRPRREAAPERREAVHGDVAVRVQLRRLAQGEVAAERVQLEELLAATNAFETRVAKDGAERRAQEQLQRECKAAGLAPPPAAKSSNVDSDGYADWW